MSVWARERSELSVCDLWLSEKRTRSCKECVWGDSDWRWML